MAKKYYLELNGAEWDGIARLVTNANRPQSDMEGMNPYMAIRILTKMHNQRHGTNGRRYSDRQLGEWGLQPVMLPWDRNGAYENRDAKIERKGVG